MISVVITKQNFMDAYDAHADHLRRFIRHFTSEEARIEKILDGALWEVLGEAMKRFWDKFPTPLVELVPFAEVLRITRRFALDYLKADPLFDPWAPFEGELNFFPLTDPKLTEFHRVVFYLQYCRDVSLKDIADRYHTTEEDVRKKLRETLKSMFATMKADVT